MPTPATRSPSTSHASTVSTGPLDPRRLRSSSRRAAREGRVVWVGEDRELESQVTRAGDRRDAEGACVIPGLVDAHTHPVFAGSRADEFFERVSGVTYTAQQSGERGIARTVRATREADGPMLIALAQGRANRFLPNGTTTIEAKTGYGLDLDNEAKLLDVLRQLAGWTPLRVVPTFLGAHVPPPGIDRDAYVRSLIDEMLPAFTPWAVFCDAWCEAPAFTAKETRAILTRARALGYELRVHAAQLAPGEGPDIAAELKARSADHLEFATPTQIKALAQAGTVAVLCPGANFTTHGPRPPLEAMRPGGVRCGDASQLRTRGSE